MKPIFPMAAEFGLPQWVFGMATYRFESAERLVCLYNASNVWSMGVLTLGAVPTSGAQLGRQMKAAPWRPCNRWTCPMSPSGIRP